MAVRRVSPVWLVIVCCLSQFLHNVYGSVVNTALPSISRDLGAGLDSLQWLVSAYILALASTLSLAGTLADRFGRKRIMMLGDLIMVVGSVVCAMSTTVPMLIVGRVIQGIGSALIAPAGLALLSAAFPKTAARAISVMWWTTVGTASLAAGPILGGFLVTGYGWQAVFWAGVPLGLVAFVLAAALLKESKSEERVVFQPFEQLLVTLFLAGLAFALIEGAHLGWASPAVLIAAVVAVGSLAVLMPYERRHPHPLIPLHLLADRAFATALTTAVVSYLALAGLLFLNTFYLQSERGLDATAAGLMTLPLAGGATVSALLAAEFVARGRSTLALLVSGTLVAAGSLALWATEGAPLWAVIVPYFIFGLGFGLVADPISVTALSSLPTNQSGLASSLISMSKQVGQMLGIAVVGAILSSTAARGERAEFESMSGWVWALLAATGMLVVVLNALTRSRHEAPTRFA